MGSPMPGLGRPAPRRGRAARWPRASAARSACARARTRTIRSATGATRRPREETFGGDWFHSKDAATQDEDGYIWYAGRADDVIIAAGYRIGPFEVESACLEHEAVREAAAVASPDEIKGNVVKAFIVLAEGHEPSDELADDIKRFVRERLSAYAYPRRVEFVDRPAQDADGQDPPHRAARARAGRRARAKPEPRIRTPAGALQCSAMPERRPPSPPARGAVSRGAASVRRARPAARDGARPQGRPRGGRRPARCALGEARWRSTCRRSSRASTSPRGGAVAPVRASRGGWPPRRGARGGRGFSPTAPRRATWPPAWPSRSAASASSSSAPSTRSTIDGLVLAGLRAHLRRARGRRRARHRALRPARRARRGAGAPRPARRRRSSSRRPTTAPWPTSPGSPRVAHAPRRAARRRRGVGRAPGLQRRAARSTRWPPAPTSSSRARTSTPAASPSRRCSTSGPAGASTRPPIDRALRLVTSTSPSSLLLASLDAARRHAALEGGGPAARGGRRARGAARARSAASPGSTSSTSAWSGRFGVAAIDPLRRVRRRARDRASAATRSRGGCAATTTSTSSSAASTSSSRCSGSASRSRRPAREPRRGRSPQRARVGRRLPPGAGAADVRRARVRPAPPWGELALSPRAAFLAAPERGGDRRRPRAGSRRSAWPPIRPASPTCCPASA